MAKVKAPKKPATKETLPKEGEVVQAPKRLSLLVTLFDNEMDRAYAVNLPQTLHARILSLLGEKPEINPEMVLIPASLSPINIAGDTGAPVEQEKK